MQTRPAKLLGQMRHTLRLKHYAPSAEGTYVNWIKRYNLFHDRQHPCDMGIDEVLGPSLSRLGTL
jgi:hypothetical protein